MKKFLLGASPPPTCPTRPDLHRDRGAVAALEFAIVAPVLLLMILAMVCLGLYFTYIHEIQELASSAARASVAGLTAAERDSLARQFVANATSNSPFLSAADVSVTTAVSGTTNYAVTIAYDLHRTPVPALAALVSIQAANITRTSTIQFGNY